MKRTTVAGVCAALALAGVVAPSASADKPVPVTPTAVIETVEVGTVWKLPSSPVEQWGCDATLTATVTGITSNRYYARFMSHVEDPWFSGWQELTNWGPIRLTRGQTEVTYTAHPAGSTDYIPYYKGFRLDLVSRQHGRDRAWNVVTSSPEVTVNWDETTCVKP